MESESGRQSINIALASSQPAQEHVTVNLEVCRRVAGLLSTRNIPIDREDSSLPWMSPRDMGNFYLLLVAICHQTSPRGRPPLEGEVDGKHLRGWDYLSAKFQMAVRLKRDLLSPMVWAGITAKDVRRIFRDDVLGDRLSDPEGRALLIRDIGQKMQKRSWNSVDQLYEAAQSRIATGPKNLLSLLSEFRAYDDPVKKKSFFFLALMHNSELWNYADPDQLGAPVDYHEVRGHLRLGTVKICNAELYAKLMSGSDVTDEEDISIRHTVFKAIMFISECSGMRNPSQLHYLFWNVFRSCCSREKPHCHSCPSNCALPDRYVPLALFPGGARRCPFSPVCQSAGREPKLIEHSFETDYY